MKRPFALLALPLVLFSLMMGVKWRAEHPTPTKMDLAIQQSLVQAQWVKVIYFSPQPHKNGEIARLSPNQRQLLSERLCLSNGPVQFAGNEPLRVAWLPRNSDSVNSVDININHEVGTYIGFNGQQRQANTYQLHPATVRHLLSTLLCDAQVGPKLRKAMEK